MGGYPVVTRACQPRGSFWYWGGLAAVQLLMSPVAAALDATRLPWMFERPVAQSMMQQLAQAPAAAPRQAAQPPAAPPPVAKPIPEGSLSSSVSRAALPPTGPTLMEIFQLARDNDPKIRAAQADFNATEQVLRQAQAGFLPSLRAEFERTQSRQHIIASNNPIFGAGFAKFPTHNYTVALTQPIFRLDLMERLDQARAMVRQAYYTRLAAEQDLMQRTATAYLSVLAARDSVDLARAEKDSLRRQLDLAEGRLKGGTGTIINLHDVSARHAVAEAREIEAGNKLQDARQALREIIATDIAGYRRLRESMPLALPEPADPSQWVNKSVEQNLGLRAKIEAVVVAQQEMQRQRAGHMPTLNLLGNQNLRDSGSTLFGGGSTVGTTEFTLRLSVPIYEGGLTSAVTAEAAFRHVKAQEEREQEMRSVERQARAVYQSVVSGVSLVRALQQSARSQQSAVEAREVGARTGVYTTLQVLDSQRELFLARRDAAQARYEYLLNTLRLKQTAGSLAEEDLAAVNELLE